MAQWQIVNFCGQNKKNMMIVDTYFNAEVSSADQFTYKIFQQNALQNM